MSDAYTFVKRRRVGNTSAKLVLIAIAEYVDENGVGRPSSLKLRDDTELSARTISSALDLLEEKGIISRERAYTERGRRAPDVITLRGYADWLSGLVRLGNRLEKSQAKSAPSEMHVQQVQVQDVHVQIPHVQTATEKTVISQATADPPPDANFARAIPQEELLPSKVEEPLILVEGAVPKRQLRALDAAHRAEAERVADDLWLTWPPAARKRHTRVEVVAAALTQIKAGFRAADMIAAGRRHVAERVKSGENFVKGLAPFLSKGLWQNWLCDDESYAPPIDHAEWSRRIANFNYDGAWVSSWGPRPNERGYQGPPIQNGDARHV